MSAIIKRDEAAVQIERVLVAGDLAKLGPEERLSYYKMVCDSVGLNPLTRPFEYITLNGKLTLYARKDATDQLRNVHQVSVEIVAREVVEECYVVTSVATMPNGRKDSSIGAVAIGGLKGEAKCNALMKAETKAKRRVTLSICGLGILDETEIETIPSARPPQVVTGVTEKPVTFRKPSQESAPVSNPGSNTLQEGSSHGADTPSTEAPPSLVAEVPPASVPAPAVEYITAGQAANLHREFRATVKKFAPAAYLKADDHFYQFLVDNGFVGDDGPTAGKIPANRWFPVKDAALKHARNLAQ